MKRTIRSRGLLVLLLSGVFFAAIPVAAASAETPVDPNLPVPTLPADNGCGGARPWDATNEFSIGVPRPTVNGEQFQGVVHAWDTDGSQTLDGSVAGQPVLTQSVYVPLTLTDGHTYGWYASTYDGTSYSEPTATCYFTVDRTSPSAAVITNPDFPRVGTPGEPTKSDGQATTFSFSSSEQLPSGCAAVSAPDCQVSGLDHFAYAVDDTSGINSPSHQLPVDSSGKGSVTLSFNWGSHTLYIDSVDAAGNHYNESTYSFTVPWKLGADPVSISPTGGPAHTSTAFTVQGTRLSADDQITLTRTDGSTPVPVSVKGQNADGSLSALVDLTGVAIGTWDVTVNDPNGMVGSLPQAFTVTDEPAKGVFVPLAPARLLDTRSGNGAAKAAVGAGKTVSLQVTGRGGVPKTGVTAVVLNVTAVSPTATSYVTAYPDGRPRPTTSSNVDFRAKQTVANLVTVGVGSDGKVDLYNHTGSVNLLADVAGYYTTAATGSQFVPLAPTRLLDTRSGNGAAKAAVGAGKTVSLQVTGRGGVPKTGVTAVVLNVTAVSPTATSYVMAYPHGVSRPTVSNLNFSAKAVISGLVTVKVGSNGRVDLYNHAGSVNLLADVAGYYTADPASGTGSSFVPVSPVRMLDTRNGLGAPAAVVRAHQTLAVGIADEAGMPSDVTAVVLNVTAVGTTTSGFVAAYPDGLTRPTVSNLNFSAGETIANLVVVPVGADGKVDLYNNAGSVNLLADLAGYYVR